MPTDVPPRTPALFPRLRHLIAMVSTRVRPGTALPGPVRADVPPPELSRWSTAWRYLLASAVGLVLVLIVPADLIPQERFEDVPEDVAAAVTAILVLDVLLGLLGLLLLPLRRRRPVLTAAVTAALTGLSASAFSAAAFATVSLGTRRRPAGMLGVGAVWVGAALVHELAYRPSFSAVPIEEPIPLLALLALVLTAYAVCVAIGAYVRARRELVASLRQRAVTELEQELRSTAAREAERTRIAREMHDVLAHRISLVALHAGALTYRDDLTAEQAATTAGVVQDNAHLALTELRQVLGVLRSGTPDPAGPPQPTLAELPALLADAAKA